MTISAPEYGFVVDEDVMVPMRDGIRLATDIYRPATGDRALQGPLPAEALPEESQHRHLLPGPLDVAQAFRGQCGVPDFTVGRMRRHGGIPLSEWSSSGAGGCS